MIYVTLKDQSSAADWREIIQLLSEDDSQPIWTSIPVDLVITMHVIPEGVCTSRDYGSEIAVANAAVISASTDDVSGQLTALVNGFIEIVVDDSVIGVLAPDRFGILKRYLVFIKIQTAGETMQLITAILPVYRGA